MSTSKVDTQIPTPGAGTLLEITASENGTVEDDDKLVDEVDKSKVELPNKLLNAFLASEFEMSGELQSLGSASSMAEKEVYLGA